MKMQAVLIAVLLMSVETQAQQWETPVFKHGNIRVYEKVRGEGRIILREGPVDPAIKPSNNGPDTVGYRTYIDVHDYDLIYSRDPVGADRGINTFWYGALYLNAEGVVMRQQEYGQLTTVYPWYVAVPPAADTVAVLDSSRSGVYLVKFTNFRMFDTVVFSQQVQAMSYEQLDSYGTQVIVAEKFGVVRMVVPYCDECEWYLSSAVLDGVAYNYELKTMNMPRVCPDFEAEYELKSQEGAISRALGTVRDTVINGTSYYVFPMLGYTIFRYEQNDVIAYRDGGESIVAPIAVSLGTLIGPENMIVDTFSIKLNGKLRLACTYGWFDNDNAYWITWMDGAGLYETADWSYFLGTSYQRLVRFTSCGQSFTILGQESVPEPIPSASRIFSAPYPNPVSLSQGAVEVTTAQTITQPITIAVTDVLGRQVDTQRLNPTGPGTALRIPLRNIGPGLYYLSITGATINETKKMVVVR